MKTAPGITVSGHADIGPDRLFAPIDLELAAGRWTCLLGGSGVGKTTILRLIANLPVAADFTGRIAAADNQIVEPRIAYMAQSDLLLPWATVRQNVTLGARLRGEATDETRVNTILERVYLIGHAHKRPGQLSGGQRQRVALARTLLEDKPVILLDEPFSALDAQTRAQMQDLAVELLEHRTVLMVTHDPGEAARLGHSIAVLDANGIRMSAPPDTPVPRPIDALSTLECQAELLRQLMDDAA